MTNESEIILIVEIDANEIHTPFCPMDFDCKDFYDFLNL